MEFMTTRPYITDWNEKNLGMGGNKKLYSLMRWGLDRYLNRCARPSICAWQVQPGLPMPELVKKASEVTSVGVQAGEGWLLTGEILELIESGCPNVICAQPFACLPNHVTGRGMFGKIRRLHPDANIVSIDYDRRLTGQSAQPHQADDRRGEEEPPEAERGRLTDQPRPGDQPTRVAA